MNEFGYQKKTKSELLVNKDLVVETEVLEEGSRDLYDIIKFCCAVKENPFSPNLKEWSRKRYDSNLDALVYENSPSVTPNNDEKTAKVLSYAQRAQIYAMTAITALNAGDAEEAVVTEGAEKAVSAEINRSTAAPAASANEPSISPVPVVDVDTVIQLLIILL